MQIGMTYIHIPMQMIHIINVFKFIPVYTITVVPKNLYDLKAKKKQKKAMVYTRPKKGMQNKRCNVYEIEYPQTMKVIRHIKTS